MRLCGTNALITLAVLLPAARCLVLHGAPSQSPADIEDEVVVEHSVVKALSRPHHLDNERHARSNMTVNQCREMTQVLKRNKETSLAARLFQIACENEYECNIGLPDMSTGCLFAAKNKHLEGMLSTIGRPNPCAFVSLFYNSYFGTGACPHPLPFVEGKAISHSGVSYSTCFRGFTTTEQSCAHMKKLNEEKPGVPSIYAVDAVMGLPESWERSMLKYQNYMHSQAVLRKSAPHRHMPKARRSRAGEEEPLKAQFYSCPLPQGAGTSASRVESWADPLAKDKSDLRKLVKDQVHVLQQAYKGELNCEGRMRNTQFEDTGIRFQKFKNEDLKFIEDENCSSCEMNYESLWQKYLPEEQGFVKVLLCQTSGILGVSAFPWEEASGTMFDFRTLPNGGMFKYDMGKTMVHEFGHYLGLFHTFQNGCYGEGDHVDDTSKEYTAFFGCPDLDSPPVSCNDGVDSVNNFMDYTDDRCMCSFTAGQRDRLAQKDWVSYVNDLE